MMINRPLHRLLAVLGLLLLLAALAAAQQARSAVVPPNVVLLFADDLGYGDLSSFGHPTIRTPYIDRLGEEGIRLTSFYVAAPGCSPSRAALLTGRYPVRTGVTHVLFPQEKEGLPPGEVTLAEALREQGYATYMVGKWHLGHRPGYRPTDQGFDHFFGLPYSNDMTPPWVRTDVPIPLLRDTVAVEVPVDQTRLTARYTEQAVEYLRGTSREQPFLLYMAYNMPHLPLRVPDEFRGRSRAGLYGDVIEMIDWSAGRILQALNEIGAADNTIVIFTSDNGPWSNMPDRMLNGGVERWHGGSAGLLRGAKGTTYEGGLRVPAVIRWPGQVEPGQTSAEMATTMDLYVTLIEAAGGEVPRDRPVDGHDLRPFLSGQTESPTTDIFYYFLGHDLESVREGPWKLRWTRRGRSELARGDSIPPELYHLDLDPAEQINRAPSEPERVRQLRDRMRKQAAEMEGVHLVE